LNGDEAHWVRKFEGGAVGALPTLVGRDGKDLDGADSWKLGETVTVEGVEYEVMGVKS